MWYSFLILVDNSRITEILVSHYNFSVVIGIYVRLELINLLELFVKI